MRALATWQGRVSIVIHGETIRTWQRSCCGGLPATWFTSQAIRRITVETECLISHTRPTQFHGRAGKWSNLPANSPGHGSMSLAPLGRARPPPPSCWRNGLVFAASNSTPCSGSRTGARRLTKSSFQPLTNRRGVTGGFSTGTTAELVRSSGHVLTRLSGSTTTSREFSGSCCDERFDDRLRAKSCGTAVASGFACPSCPRIPS